MKIPILTGLLWLALTPQAEAGDDVDLTAFAQTYFDAWTDSQRPDATPADLDAYLALLAEDVGHQHLPYDPDDGRAEDGKDRMRQGMTHYLGAHTRYSATLTNVLIGHQVIVLQYASRAEGIRPDTGATVSVATDMTEILELEGGRVSVIRKYSD